MSYFLLVFYFANFSSPSSFQDFSLLFAQISLDFPKSSSDISISPSPNITQLMPIVLHLTLYICPNRVQISQTIKNLEWFTLTCDFTITRFICQLMVFTPPRISNIMSIPQKLVDLHPFEVCDTNGQNTKKLHSGSIAPRIINFAHSVLIVPNRHNRPLKHLYKFFPMQLMTC